ncbi:unnamed protein product [Boreogadus saida]
MKFKVETVKWAWPSARNGFGFFVYLKMLLSLEGAASNEERIVLPEASTERVWSWELQVDGGQEPFSPTGTDGRGDGGARREVRGGRLEVLAVRSVAVVWRRTEAEVLEAGQPGDGGGLEVLEASNLEGAAWRARSWLLIQRVPAVASTRRRRRSPGGPGGGDVLEGPAAATSWRARRRPGGPGGGVLEGPAASWRARRRRLLIQLS